MPGSRDFLIGADFASPRGLRRSCPPNRAHRTGDEAVLLCHGDSLCTDDLAYQAFRSQVRNPAWQAQFLGQPWPCASRSSPACA